MLLSDRLKWISLFVAIALLTSCSGNDNTYTVTVATPGHDVYKISRQGVVFREEAFDVILVYGFNDNRIVGEQIVAFLNREEPDSYFLVQVAP